MNHIRDTILHMPKLSKKRHIMLSLVTSYSAEGQNVSQKITSEWNIIQNEPTLSQMRPSNPALKQSQTSPFIWRRLIYLPLTAGLLSTNWYPSITQECNNRIHEEHQIAKYQNFSFHNSVSKRVQTLFSTSVLAIYLIYPESGLKG